MLERSDNRRSWLVSCLLVVGASALLGVLVYVRGPMMALSTNSDSLLPADMAWEWLNRPDMWRSFQWPRIPSLVPDLLIYVALQAAWSWRVAQIGTGIVFLASLAGFAGWIATRLRPVSGRSGSLAFLAATSVLLLVESAFSTTDWHFYIFAVAYHSGPFILSVGTLILARKGGTWPLLLMATLAALGTFSDRMVVGTFLIPLLAALYSANRHGEMPRRIVILTALLALAGCALGLAADKVVFPLFLTRQTDAPLKLGNLIQDAVIFLGSQAVWFVLALNASVLIRLSRKTLPPLARFWWTAAAAAMVPSSLLAAGLWQDDTSQRYLSAVLWWPVILWAPAIAERLRRFKKTAVLAMTGAAAVAFARIVSAPHPLLSWQNPIAACLAPTGRTAGLALFWQARPITIASNWHLQVEQIKARGGIGIWGNNPSWYTSSRGTPGQLPPFSFIVMRGLDEPAIRAAYGQPDSVLPCPGSDVWLYDDPAAMRAHLAAASPALVPPGKGICVGPERLNRRGGALPSDPIHVSDDRQTARPVTFGPNIDLHPGRWRVTLHYRLQTDRPGEDRWLVNGQWGTLHLAGTPLPPSGEGIAVSEADIVLSREIEAVEVPTYLAGTATLQIVQACFTPR